MKSKSMLTSPVLGRMKDLAEHSELAFARYLKSLEKPDEEYLPSKLICVRYTLSVCGCNPKDAEKLIDEMIEHRKTFDEWEARQRWDEFAKSMGV